MKKIIYLLLAVGLYLGLCYTPGLRLIAFPIELLCTFLHEFGHALFSIITGGGVRFLQVNMDGSGLTGTEGGYFPLILLGGYVGSALFGNIMIRLSNDKYAGIVMKVISGAMLFSSIFWFDNMTTTIALIVSAVVLAILSFLPFRGFILSFLGVASVIYIIQDFNVGPTGDIELYEQHLGVSHSGIWIYVWLGLVLAMTAVNLFTMVKLNKNKEKWVQRN